MKRLLVISTSLLTLMIILSGVWLYRLNQQLNESLNEQWFLPPIEIYASSTQLLPQMNWNAQKISQHLIGRRIVNKGPDSKLSVNEFSVWSNELCQAHLPEPLSEEAKSCVAFTFREDNQEHLKAKFNLLVLSEDRVLATYSGEPLQPVSLIPLPPRLFAQYNNEKPVLRRLIDLGNAPLQCLQAVTAIEDDQFLDHQGISIKGILRAVYNLITRGRISGGGSTITQQLVKNYFLTSEQTFKRKFTELFMAILLESKLEKDEIFKHYLNVIYMGQNGPFQVRGFGSAAEHYFGKKLERLNLEECALLAAVLNCPGCFNPFTKPERAAKRRRLVLERMQNLNMIDADTLARASATPLPQRPPRLLTEPAPYFVQMVYKELRDNKIEVVPGLKIFTTLNEEAQEAAYQSINDGLEAIEKRYKKIKSLKEKKKLLQALLVSVDLKTGGINALMGGRSYKNTQYNRVTQAHRQVGSIMKPLVYLTALENETSDGKPYTPLTLISDNKFTHQYEGQNWSPKNYDRQYHGELPMFYALKSSYNSAAARLGLDVGLDKIVATAQRLGVTSEIKPLPSLTLGAFELYPREVLHAFGTIARFGRSIPLHSVIKVTNSRGEKVYAHESKTDQLTAPEVAAVLVSMLKQTVESGTARSIRRYGFDHPAAGKTGTTSDTKDAWFAGFTPHILALSWVGYDDNTPHGLTGASGAVPLWVRFMKDFATQYPVEDFRWPEGTTVFRETAEDLQKRMPQYEIEKLTDVELVFQSGTEP